jgi:ABC-type nickel/cobalt efflux system permease component RcnA
MILFKFILGTILTLDTIALVLVSFRKEKERDESFEAIFDFIRDKDYIPTLFLRIVVLLVAMPLTIPYQIKKLFKDD